MNSALGITRQVQWESLINSATHHTGKLVEINVAFVQSMQKDVSHIVLMVKQPTFTTFKYVYLTYMSKHEFPHVRTYFYI